MTPRTCPNCKVVIPLDHGFHFDEKMNMICDYCQKYILFVEDLTTSSYPYTDANDKNWNNKTKRFEEGGKYYGDWTGD